MKFLSVFLPFAIVACAKALYIAEEEQPEGIDAYSMQPHEELADIYVGEDGYELIDPLWSIDFDTPVEEIIKPYLEHQDDVVVDGEDPVLYAMFEEPVAIQEFAEDPEYNIVIDSRPLGVPVAVKSSKHKHHRCFPVAQTEPIPEANPAFDDLIFQEISPAQEPIVVHEMYM